MTDFIVALPAADAQWDEQNPQPGRSVRIAEYDAKEAYLYSGSDPTEFGVTSYIVGAWNPDTGLQVGQSYDVDGVTVLGTPTYPLHADYLTYIRPLGNESGRATGHLDTHRWQGHSEAKFVEDAKRYPDTDAPFQLKIERVDHTADPVFPGWGWKVTMISADPVRDITARAVGIYSDEACTAYLYTTGAFVNDGSGIYYTECPVGQRTANPNQVNFALLLGSLQEGFFNLPAGRPAAEALFWSHNQGEVPGPGVPDWSGLAVSYAVNDHVMYNGVEYRCLQAHTSQPGWTPVAVPALWAVV